MSKPLGELLKDAGIINQEMIDYALKVQTITRERLGDVLLRLRFVTDSEVARTLASQSGFIYNSLEGVAPGCEVLRHIPYKVAQKFDLLPLGVQQNYLMVAVADPFDATLEERLRRHSPYALQIHVAPRSRLRHQIELSYYLAENPVAEDVKKIVEAIQQGHGFDAGKLLTLLVSAAIDVGASDIHITPTEFSTLVSFRVDGVLQLGFPLPCEAHSRLISSCKIGGGMDIAEQHRPQDGRMSFPFLNEHYDIRISSVPTIQGENLVLRILSGGQEVLSLEDLGFLPDQISKLLQMVHTPYGILLTTGPTGSGKTTTQYALVRKLNAMQKNIMTIEDPVEYRIPLIHQVAVNEKAGVTFASTIRSFLRQDPDVILVGEVRDEETATLAMRAAQTGHLVLTSLHTNDASGAIARLRDLGVDNFLLSSSLIGIIAQRLARKLCLRCRKEVVVSEQDAKRFGFAPDTPLFESVGCEDCRYTGYSGRISIGEILEMDGTMREMIDRGDSSLQISQYAHTRGMRSLRRIACEFVVKGITDIKEIDRIIR